MSKSLKLRLRALQRAKYPAETGVLSVPPGLTSEEAQALVFTPTGPRRPERLIIVHNRIGVVFWTDEDLARLRKGDPEVRASIYWKVS